MLAKIFYDEVIILVISQMNNQKYFVPILLIINCIT